MSHIMPTTLIDCATLHAHLGDPDWVVLDCRFELANPTAGEVQYAQGHVPGAIYVHLDRDLSARKDAGAINGGRHPLPSRVTACERFGAIGVGDGSQVVVLDAAGGAFAARAWWMLRWIGHARVAVLDGGMPAWQKAGLPIAAEPATRRPARLTLRPGLARHASADDVLASLGRDDCSLIDARGPDRYDGSAETIDPVGGHVPGAINLPFAGNLGADGRFKPASELAARFSRAVAGKQVIHQCGSGVTACHNILAAVHAGLPEGALYAGSWSEWIEDPSRPRWTPGN